MQSNNHTFNLDLNWHAASDLKSAIATKTIKNHVVHIAGKSDLNISAAKSFKGDPSLHNPEDLLLASLASCHMMSYLYCCTQEKIEVISYQDHAEAILEVYDDGSGRIVKVILRPEVIIADPIQLELANSLHIKANKLCFIANSCNFSVEHYAKISELIV